MLIHNFTDFTKHIANLGLVERNSCALIITLPDDTSITVRHSDDDSECALVITHDSKILLNSIVTYEIAADALRYYSNLAHWDIACAATAAKTEAPF